jgi:hypothetical protein
MQLLDQADDGARPSWFDYYDRARLAGFQGYAHIRLRHPRAAHIDLEDAIRALSPDAAKQRACFLADRATVHVREGDIDAACDLGIKALGILREVEYATGITRVRRLREALKPHAKQASVVELTEHLLAVA